MFSWLNSHRQLTSCNTCNIRSCLFKIPPWCYLASPPLIASSTDALWSTWRAFSAASAGRENLGSFEIKLVSLTGYPKKKSVQFITIFTINMLLLGVYSSIPRFQTHPRRSIVKFVEVVREFCEIRRSIKRMDFRACEFCLQFCFYLVLGHGGASHPETFWRHPKKPLEDNCPIRTDNVWGRFLLNFGGV